MRSTVRLAQTLAGFTPDELERLLFVRRINPEVQHFTELSLALLTEENITRTLRNLESSTLRALQTVQQHPGTTLADTLFSAEKLDQLRLLGLITSATTPDNEVTVEALPEVGHTLEQLLEKHGPLPEVVAPIEALPAPASHIWAQRVFLEAQQAALILRASFTTPLKLTRSGSVSKVSIKILTDEIRASEDAVPVIVSGLLSLNALTLKDQLLIATPDGDNWSVLPHAERWLLLAAASLGEMPEALRVSLGSRYDLGEAASSVLPSLLPLLDTKTMEQVTQFVHRAEHLGITQNGVLLEPIIFLLRGEISAALELIREAFPPEAGGVYLQPDLTVIAPGPLQPSAGLRLLDLADLTAPGLATSFSFSERSLSRALERGWTADTIVDFLTEISLTPIPQPLAYLINDVGARHGTITVSPLDSAGDVTVIEVRDARFSREIAADSRLQFLGLRPAQDTTLQLHTRISIDHVLSILTSARYPAIRKPGPGEHSVADHPRTPDTATALARIPALLDSRSAVGSADVESLHETARRLCSHTAQNGILDIVPMLELAARTGETVLITVTDGKQEQLLPLQPIIIAKGRLRALDPKAQLERTVALRAITRVAPIDPGTS